MQRFYVEVKLGGITAAESICLSVKHAPRDLLPLFRWSIFKESVQYIGGRVRIVCPFIVSFPLMLELGDFVDRLVHQCVRKAVIRL